MTTQVISLSRGGLIAQFTVRQFEAASGNELPNVEYPGYAQ
ncbi:MAG TPA: hypothetical protein VK633_13980 [Verrucomicrobiae bacterium]|nr:hypothetical protein [Verrucomicrobiae bacterium]